MERAFEIGDRATGTNVLAELYQRMGLEYASIDLGSLWRQLGVERQDGQIRLNEAAPLTAVRLAILA